MDPHDTSSATRRTGTRPPLLQPGLGEMLGYWQSLRPSPNAVPGRASIEPREIEPFLSHSGILEKTMSGAGKFRLAGQRFHTLMGMEPRGMPLRALFDVSSRERLQSLTHALFDGPAIVTLGLYADQGHQPPLHGQIMLMPLADVFGEINRALTMIWVDEATPPVAPIRFRISERHVSPITLRAEASGTPQMPPVRVQVRKGERPALRVITGGLG